MKNDGLLNIIDYINNNFRFGSEVNIERFESLFKQYQLTDNDKKRIFKELDSLKIKIRYSKEILNIKINRLFKCVGKEIEIKDQELNKWFEDEVISCDMQKQIYQSLNTLGYKIIEAKERQRNDSLETLDLIDEEFEDFDEFLDSEFFNKEVLASKNKIDKNNNLEYLIDLQSTKGDFQKKEQALDNLVNANGKLVWKIVSKYKRFSTNSFDCNDMYQVGVIGLIKASEKFDICRENQFSTYATYWIKQNIERNIADYSTMIRIPVHMRARIIKYIKIENEFWNKNGRAVNDGELANLMSVTKKEIEELKRYKVIGNLTSLDTAIGEDEENFLGAFIPDEKQKGPDELVEENELKREFDKILKKNLTEREVSVVKLRFGLDNGEGKTLEEIGKGENVTRERIRQIESKAMSKLRKSKILEGLRDFYYDRM